MKKIPNSSSITLQKPAITKKKVRKAKKNNKKIAKIRRQRGYNWEDTIVKRFNGLNEWKAFRLGSPSVGLPDVLAISTKNSTIFTIEAKSGTGTSLLVPFDQILRCLKWTDTFELYKERKVILAFKFLSKKRIDVGEYESRELREFFKIWDNSLKVTDCVCTYEGNIFSLEDGNRIKINLMDYPMPFNSKYQIFSRP
jgi:Holliday junction resolvase